MPHPTQMQRRAEAIQVEDAEATKVTGPADPVITRIFNLFINLSKNK
jgi:hypothetical protein